MLIRVRSTPFVLTCALVFGCDSTDADDTVGDTDDETGEDPKLFEEAGVWSLQKYALDGAALEDVSEERRDSFLFKFQAGVVAVAGCYSDANQDIESAICLGNPGAAYWECECFAYEFENSRMVWQPFVGGDPIPEVGDPDVGGSGAFEVLVEEYTALALAYQFSPLPPDTFDSDGMISKYVMQQKADQVWDAPDVDPASEPGLDECSAACFSP